MHEFDLDPGLTLLRTESPRSTIVHRLACDRLADADGPAYWIDARNAAATHVLYDCVPRPRMLDDLRVARAFTAYQHHSLVRAVTRRARPDTDLLVAPNVAALYRDDDVAEWERDLLAASLETLSELGRVLECPVLVTSASDADAKRITDRATTTIDCVRTREGIRLESADGDRLTEGYWHGEYWQTTIPYWVDLCGAVDALDPVAAHDRGLLEVTA
ncbi:hypothetical protein ACFO5R_18345 [Halosolutus amylolyticus]|uniref:Uncharacterized protein n=1 Tax=Halosolutus amylolyticus TaxID=2932267 RepID=A0ABD5PUD0_9EURY|nr:hypothetical protein [Halosolutus amylolyticus]